MKKLFFLLLILSNALFAQETENSSGDSTTEATFEVIEHVPVYKGCDEKSSNTVLKKCMADAISKHISKRFNTDVVKGLGLPDGIVRINVIFKVDHQGHVTGIKTRGPHPVLEQEAYRVIEMIPKFTKPGYQRGNPVTVPYALPIMFMVDNSKYQKKKK